MALSVWISPALQYGALDPGESKARQGALQRAVVQAIKWHLFEGEDAYERVLPDFAARLKPEFTISNEERRAAQRLWQALLPEEATAPAAVAEQLAPDSGLEPEPQDTPAPVPERIEALFGFALHTLCATLAGQWVDEPNPDSGETDDDESNDDETDVPATSAAPQAVEFAQAVGALVDQLRQVTWKWQRDLSEDERPEDVDWRLVAHVLLETLLATLDDWFKVSTGETRKSGGKPHTLKVIEISQSEFAKRIERLLKTLPLSFSPQPLKQPVAYYLDDPGPSDDEADLCSRVDLIDYRQTNKFLRDAHSDIQCRKHRSPNFQRYVAAINVQQAVHWRINRPLLQWTQQLIALVNAPPANDDDASLRDWIKDHLYRPRPANGTRKTFERPAEFLDNPLASRALDELCPSDPLVDPPTFYLPWKADYRGRIYPQTSWLTPQGGDLQRGLLEFARGQVLNESGVHALRRHGANLVERSRLLTDLGISDRQVVTLNERERWTRDHEAAILASAADPLAEPFWRDVADKPMQFLAFCLAYRQWKQHPDARIHLPVQIDGTCNGIQHIAALTGNRELAEAVNVLPRANDLPADIYSELAEAALKTLGHLPIPKGQARHRHGLEWGDAWLATDAAPGAWLNRKTAKRVVMTIPYGAGRSAQAGAVLEAIEKRLIEVWDERPPDESKLTALVEWTNAASARKDFVRKCTKGLFVEARQAAFPKQDEHSSISIRVSKPEPKGKGKGSRKTRAKPDTEETWTPERAEWERLRTFGAYVARVLVEQLRGALDRNYRGIGEFSNWLGEVAESVSFPQWTKEQRKKIDDAKTQCKKKEAEKFEEKPDCLGLPLIWLTPLGFPVVQNKFASARTSVSARIGGQAVKIDVRRLTEEVDPQKQRAALLPNLIHSLDATHLMLTLLEAKAREVHDIGSIHDCLLCHPNQAETLAQVVRQTFAELYAPYKNGDPPGPLTDWYSWMQKAVALRTLPRRGEVNTALKYPGGQTELDLRHEADSGKQEARDALLWLAAIRSDDLPSSERFLFASLLDLATALITPAPSPDLPEPPVSAALPLSESAISPYFFS
ncbi:DNA-directed RNA polymerase bacteriophage type [Thiorhodococcus drewsii AZ1]|uniref:DNA-directed RNA polymerase n=1 Tax=Thiorhodococcus drewsii AZ1 TaxID=765913 RepID=G2DYN3_9GAMM|nr:DNA-directed RNA polymerase [Thiorhodococcus drewsii]EGV32660.1 DNA-directed RNA polymerase bacteriophage type [Thiorhodococcus drewsii AZ1]